MIDEKKLIEILSKNSIFEKITNAEGKNIFNIIDEQPKTDCFDCTRREWYQKGYQDGLNADKWIPVEERLPQVDTEVLITNIFGNLYVYTLTKDGERFLWEDDYGMWTSFEDVIAWKPLPQPYKKEGAE